MITFFRTNLSKALVLAISTSFAVPGIGFAQETEAPMSMEQIEAAYNAKEFDVARQGLVSVAKAGNAKAAYRLGYMMANSIGGPFDQAGAITWLEAGLAGQHNEGHLLLARLYLTGNPEVPHYERAAELLQYAVEGGSADAHFYLAQLLRSGRGIEANKEQAFRLLRTAAAASHAGAAFSLAEMYSRGEGVTADPTQSARWLLDAAENGYGEAQLSLYFNYSRGTGFPKDETVALAWLQEAVKSGNVMAEQIFGAGLLLGRDPMIEANPELGIEILKRAASKGSAPAQSNLGYAYFTGTAVDLDKSKAVEWYTAAADQGLLRAALVLGEVYSKGDGVDVDFVSAKKYFEIAAQRQDRTALSRLGSLLVAGSIEEESLEKQYNWIAAAADAGDETARDWLKKESIMEPFAAFRLALIYRDGLGTKADLDVAAPYFIKAAKAGFVQAQEALVDLYSSGTGVEQDYVEAHKWANVAAANGSESATERRDLLAQLMTADQVAEAQARAKSFMAGK